MGVGLVPGILSCVIFPEDAGPAHQAGLPPSFGSDRGSSTGTANGERHAVAVRALYCMIISSFLRVERGSARFPVADNHARNFAGDQ